MVKCIYNGDCDASLYKEGYQLNPVKELKRSNKTQSNITKSIKELTWNRTNFQTNYGGIYFCELTDCNSSANNSKKRLEIEVKGKLLKLPYDYVSACMYCMGVYMCVQCMRAYAVCRYLVTCPCLFVWCYLLHVVAIFQKQGAGKTK